MSRTQAIRRSWAILYLGLLLVALTKGPVAAGPTDAPPPLSDDRAQPLPALTEMPMLQPLEPPVEGPWVVRAYYGERRMVNELAAWREPWEVHHDEGYLVLDVTQAEYQRLVEAGFRLEVDEDRTAQLNQLTPHAPGQSADFFGYPCYRTVEETFATAQAIASEHPDLATWIDIGDSWEKTTPGGDEGYDMMVLRLTNSTVPGPKPKIVILASIHAREYAPAELATRFAEYLVDHYSADPDVTWLLDYHEVHLVLQANPDGRKWAEPGYVWRKNTNNNFCADTVFRGVDLNRNFAFEWGCCDGSSSFECSELYRGPSPASEPETQAIQDYLQVEFPDQREDDLSAAAPITAMGVFLDIHSYGELVLWPWGFSEVQAPNGPALQTLGRKLAFFNDYTALQAYDLYPTDGTTDEFAYGALGLAAYTLELGTLFFQDCATFEDVILPDNLPALIYAAKASRTPYVTPSGPDAVDLILSPAFFMPGEPFSLTATIDDTRYNHQSGIEAAQNIAAAEYYIDVPPWIMTTTPIPYPMVASDGALDETVEEVEATIDTTGLSWDRHIIFVRGRDADGNWGAVSSVFVNTAIAPTAAFTNTTPVFSGVPVSFTNLTTGTPPMDYFWDFGHNQGSSVESDPSYTFISAGTFTVTLVATNSIGSDAVSHMVTVHPPQAYLPLVTKQDIR